MSSQVEPYQNLERVVSKPGGTVPLTDVEAGQMTTESLKEYTPTAFQKFLAIFWDSAASSPEERKFLNRIDLGLLIYIMLSFFIKTLDQGNISNAYVSGMKEDLSLYGNELNYFTTCFNVGYLVGSVPAQIILYKVRPSIYIPSCEIFWSVLVMLMAIAKNPTPIYILRFFIGLAECVCYPAFAMLIGSWYKPNELAKRLLLYDASWNIAYMIAGYIQAGVYASMNGHLGLAGWRWMFIIDGIISIPIGCLGYYALPDFPNNTRARWLSPEHRAFAVKRMEEIGRRGRRKMTVKRFLGLWNNWRPYAYLFPYVIFITNGANYMNLWLKSLGDYSVEMINILPTIGYAIAIVAAYTYAVVSDYTLWRWQLIEVAIFFNFIGNLLLAIWEIPFGLKFFAYIVPSLGAPIWGLLLTWGTELFQDDTELRGLLPAVGNTLWYAFCAFVPILIFPMQYAPRFKIGYWVSTSFLVAMAISILVLLWGHKCEVRKKGLVYNKYGLAVERDDLHLSGDRSSDIAEDIDSKEGDIVLTSKTVRCD
ncbi:major facilitator superfamily domain-containing protein [Lipomyces tetrasporus]